MPHRAKFLRELATIHGEMNRCHQERHHHRQAAEGMFRAINERIRALEGEGVEGGASGGKPGEALDPHDMSAAGQLKQREYYRLLHDRARLDQSWDEAMAQGDGRPDEIREEGEFGGMAGGGGAGGKGGK